MPIDQYGRFVAAQPAITASGVVQPVMTASGVVHPNMTASGVVNPAARNMSYVANPGGTVDYGGAVSPSVRMPITQYRVNPAIAGMLAGPNTQTIPPGGYSRPQQPPSVPPQTVQQPTQPAAPAPSPVVGQPGVQAYGPSQLGAAGVSYWQSPQQQQSQQFQAAPQPVAGGPSATQMAGQAANQRGGAQSVQNYLTALGQAGASNNNAAMNAPGQLGAGPVAGFTGFGNNGSYGPSFVPQGYTGMMGAGPSQVYGGGNSIGNAYGGGYNAGYAGQYGNQAAMQGNYNMSNLASQGNYGQMAAPQLANTGGISMVNGPGLLAGAQNAPQWQTPAPWGNPQNAPPGTSGSLWGDNSSQSWQNYLFAQPGSQAPGAYTQGGAFYSQAAPGQQAQDANGNPTGPVAVSDVIAKENILPATDELQEFLDALGVYSYEYKDKKHGEGRYISPMAQEFEKSKLGQIAVEKNNEGIKVVNYGKLAGVQTAALAMINQRLKDLEKKFNENLLEGIKAKRSK